MTNDVWSSSQCVKCSQVPRRGGRKRKEGGVAKSNHTVITGLTRRAEERRYSAHYVYAVAQLGHFSCHTTRTTSTSTMTTNRDKFLMRVKLHISFCLLLYLFSWAGDSKEERGSLSWGCGWLRTFWHFEIWLPFLPALGFVSLAFAYSIHLPGKPLTLLCHKNPKRELCNAHTQRRRQ